MIAPHTDAEPGPAPTAAGSSRALRWLLALYVVTAVLVGLQRTLLSNENNFLIFRAAFEHLVSGENLYAAYSARHADLFKYSPTFALLFAPFAVLPVVPGYVLWALACALAVYAGLTRLLPARQAALALALAWLSVVGDLQRAQSNALSAALMILAWVAYERRRQWGAAAAIAAGALIKIFPLAAVAGALFHPRKARFAAAFTVVLALGVALPLLVTPPGSLAMQYRAWWAIETLDAGPTARIGTGGADLYAGVMGLFQAWFGVTWPYWPTQLAGTLLLLLPAVLHYRRGGVDRSFRVRFAASILVFCVLFNHQAESPSYAIAMIGAAIWFAASERAGWRTALVAVCILIVNLGSSDLMPRPWYHQYYVPYLLKTVPLVPLWIAMQGELLGLIANRGPSERAEADEGEVAPAKSFPHPG
ncbi:MAG TPA: glycosyltransferase family 87 protein [Gemmatimonadaceae bacterium]|nr:glycosyltransferase family 87 protein [Gemmatimonadaceae bacterium]